MCKGPNVPDFPFSFHLNGLLKSLEDTVEIGKDITGPYSVPLGFVIPWHVEGGMGGVCSKTNPHQSVEKMGQDLTSLPCVGDDITVHSGNGWLPHSQGFRVCDVGCQKARWTIQSWKEVWDNGSSC